MTYPQRWRPAFSSIELATFLSIVLALILIAPIACASPPDPSWIAGIYDGADGDDVVTLVYETAGVAGGSLGSGLPVSRGCNVSLASGSGAVHGFPLHQFARGPPSPSLSSSPVCAHVPDVLARFHVHIALCSVTPRWTPVRLRVAAFLPTGGGAVTEGEQAAWKADLSCRES